MIFNWGEQASGTMNRRILLDERKHGDDDGKIHFKMTFSIIHTQHHYQSAE